MFGSTVLSLTTITPCTSTQRCPAERCPMESQASTLQPREERLQSTPWWGPRPEKDQGIPKIVYAATHPWNLPRESSHASPHNFNNLQPQRRSNTWLQLWIDRLQLWMCCGPFVSVKTSSRTNLSKDTPCGMAAALDEHHTSMPRHGGPMTTRNRLSASCTHMGCSWDGAQNLINAGEASSICWYQPELAIHRTDYCPQR